VKCRSFALLRRGEKVHVVMVSGAQARLVGHAPQGIAARAHQPPAPGPSPNGQRSNHHKQRVKIDALVYTAAPDSALQLNVSDLRWVRAPKRGDAARDLHHVDRIDDFWEQTNGICADSMTCRDNTSILFSRNANGVTTTTAR